MNEDEGGLANEVAVGDSCDAERGGDNRADADDETSAIKCFDGGGTLPTVGILCQPEKFVSEHVRKRR